MNPLISDLLSHFEGVKRCGEGFMARCPAHDDGAASLSVSEAADGKVLLNCFAGCKTEDVLKARGLKLADLFPADGRHNANASGHARSSGKIAATYDYQNEAGQLLFQVVRFEPKDFRQRRPDPAKPGGWAWNLKGVRRLLFRLPEVAEAAAQGWRVVLAEGEKDALALVKHGFTATCNPGGAGKWLDDYTAALREACVVIVADKDKPGREHAANVAAKLQGSAASVRVVECPDVDGRAVKDAADYFAAGGTAESLKLIMDTAPEWQPAPRQAPASAVEASGPTEPEPDTKAADSAEPSIIVLPSGSVSISESARVIFRRIAPSRTLFWRGGALVELVDVAGVASPDIVRPEGFCSRVEKFGNLFAWRAGGESGPALKPAQMSVECAKKILAATEAREFLPPLASVLRCPVLIETATGEVAILGRGYHDEHGGLLITTGDAPPQVELREAVKSLLWLADEFAFQDEGDRSRALAAFIAPALRLGGFIRERVPIDVAEADKSQAGKGHRLEMVATLYNEAAYFVTAKTGGVGSMDESFAAALVMARPFICLDNFRGRMDSQNLEAFLTCPSLFPARIPHRGEVLIDPKKFMLQMSSNGFESTRDLANRASICRIRKRPSFAYRDTLGELQRRQPYFLGCVFSIIGEWIAHGKPRTSDTRHDFRVWCQVLDWIVQNLLGCAPLMDGHQAAQERTSNPALSWLRAVALAVAGEGRLDVALIASELVDVCGQNGVEIPGKPVDEERAKPQVGRLMKQLFREGDGVDVDGFTVTRGDKEYRKPSGDLDYTNAYTFSQRSQTTPPPHPTPSL